MQKFPLGEVAEFVNGRAFKPDEWETEGLPIIRIQNLTGSSKQVNYYKGQVDSKYLVKHGDVLISWSASLGVYIWKGNDAVLNQHIFKVIPRKGVDKDYFYYAATYVLKEMESKVHGSTMQHITKEPFESTLITLLSIDEQRRVATILKQADRVRRLRRYARALSDGYLQSVFLEMFGDPETNPMGWEFAEIREYTQFLTSGSRGWAEYYSDEGDLFLRIQNVGKNKLILEDVAFVRPPKNSEGVRTLVNPGDLLISITADLGRTAVIPLELPKAYINQHLALVRLKGIDPIFVSGYISSPGGQNKIKQLDKAGVKSGLNFDDIKGYKVFSVPKKLQEKYRIYVMKHQKFENLVNESARQAEQLFQSLLREAFEG